jgi:vitamin B12 transporter
MRHPLFHAAILIAVAATGARAQAPVRLDTVHVAVSSRTDSTPAAAARTVDVITRAELDARAGQSLQQILGQRLGVDIASRSPAQADIAMRGSSIEQVLILVNGQRVSDEQAGHYDLDLTVPTDMIDHIEILRGTGSTLYGPNAVGGVVNIVTRRDTTASLARVESGSFGTVDASLLRDGAAGPVGLRVGGDYARSDGHRPGTDYRIGQARVSADTRLGAGRLDADAAVGVRDFGADTFYGPYPSYEDTHTSTASLRYAAPLPGRWSLDVSASGRRHIDLFTLVRSDPALYQNHHDNWQTGGDAVARYAAAPDVALAIGAEGFDARLVSARLGDHDEARSAAFAELSAGRPGGASVDAGVRGDHSSAYGGFFSPSLAASIPVGDRVRLRASVGRGFRAPTWTERFYVDPANIGSPDLRSETFWAGEVGADARLTDRLSVDAATYVRQADNLIDWARPVGSPDSVPWHTMNIESARYRGVELTARAVDVAGLDWTLRASGLSFVPQGASGYEGKYALRPITRTYGATIATPERRRFTAMLDLLDARRASETSHFRADLRLGYRWGVWRTMLDLRNLTDARYLDASGMPVAGPGAYVGLEWATP